MKRCFIAVVLAAFGIVNAQEAGEPAPTAETTPAEQAIQAQEPAPVAEVPAPVIAPAPVAETPAPEAQAVAEPATPAPEAELVAAEPAKPVKKKKRGERAPKNDFAIVDVPANFEIQARKVMPVDAKHWGDDNLDTWWGRANLMVLTESENFVGKLHLRMYPSEFYSIKPAVVNASGGASSNSQADLLQIYEAWAWHRGDYVNIKIGRWDNTTRFGSKNYGGYVDAKKDKDIQSRRPERTRRSTGFMNSYYPENMLQFGLNNFSENMSLDIALISSDEKLNRGDLRTYFRFKDLAGIENMEFGLGYRSNVFDEIYDKKTDVTHTVDLAVRMPIVKEVGFMKSMVLFLETAFIGLDDQEGTVSRADGGKIPNKNNPAFPVLGGFDFSFYRGLDKIVVEAEYDGERRNATPGDAAIGSKKHVKDIQGSIYVQKVLNDRFTLNLGVQSENNTKDFSFAGRLQGRIN